MEVRKLPVGRWLQHPRQNQTLSLTNSAMITAKRLRIWIL